MPGEFNILLQSAACEYYKFEVEQLKILTYRRNLCKIIMYHVIRFTYLQHN